MKPETKLHWSGWIGGLCLLPVLYVLSVFPLGWALNELGRGFPDWLRTFYRPLIWAAEESDRFRAWLNWIGEQVIP